MHEGMKASGVMAACCAVLLVLTLGTTAAWAEGEAKKQSPEAKAAEAQEKSAEAESKSAEGQKKDAGDAESAEAGKEGSVELSTDAEGWTEDYEAAKAYAKKHDKDLLLDFTGSDWCGWCIRLHNEVFATEVFEQTAPDHFVLVKLDFPRRTPQPEAIRKRNEALAKEFAVRGFPTIYLTDAEARPYAKTGYRRGGAEGYLAHLAELREIREARDKHLEKAKEAKGVARARQLDKALSTMDEEVVAMGYEPMIREIVKLDSKNEAGLQEKYQPMLRAIEAQEKRIAEREAAEKHNAGAMKAAEALRPLMEKGDLDAVMAKVDEIMEEHKPTGELAQQLLLLKFQVHLHRNEMDKAREVGEAVVAVDPNSELSRRVREFIDNRLPAAQKEGDGEATKEGAKEGEKEEAREGAATTEAGKGS